MLRTLSISAAAIGLFSASAAANCTSFYKQESGVNFISGSLCSESASEVRFDANPKLSELTSVTRDSAGAGEHIIEIRYADRVVQTEWKMIMLNRGKGLLRVSIPEISEAMALLAALRQGEAMTADLVTVSSGDRLTLYDGLPTVD